MSAISIEIEKVDASNPNSFGPDISNSWDALPWAIAVLKDESTK